MKLFLASEAKHPATVEKLRKYVGGFEGKKIAYIPTAANGENRYGEWETDSASWKLVNSLGMHVTAVVLEDYKNNKVLELLKDKDIIWMAGGSCSYLMYWMRRCELDKHFRKFLETSVYVGSSAGSMICSPTLDIVEWYPGEPEFGGSIIPGLGLVDFDIFPHYEDSMFDQIKKLYSGKKLYLLRNGEEIIVEDGKVTVVGEERII